MKGSDRAAIYAWAVAYPDRIRHALRCQIVPVDPPVFVARLPGSPFEAFVRGGAKPLSACGCVGTPFSCEHVLAILMHEGDPFLLSAARECGLKPRKTPRDLAKKLSEIAEPFRDFDRALQAVYAKGGERIPGALRVLADPRCGVAEWRLLADIGPEHAKVILSRMPESVSDPEVQKRLLAWSLPAPPTSGFGSERIGVCQRVLSASSPEDFSRYVKVLLQSPHDPDATARNVARLFTTEWLRQGLPHGLPTTHALPLLRYPHPAVRERGQALVAAIGEAAIRDRGAVITTPSPGP